MSKKTIWIINQTAGKLDSGWGERHYNLSKYWIKKGYTVSIISGSYNHLFINQPTTKGTFTFEKLEESIQFCWVKVPKYSNSGFKKFWSNLVFTFRVLFLSEKKIGSPEVIILSSMPIFPIISANYLKKKFRAKLLITEIRDLWPLTPIHLKGYSKNNVFIKIVTWLERFAYEKSDFIVSLLPNSKKYISSISGDKSKFKYIPNGIEIEASFAKKIPQKIIDKIPKNKFIIGYTGTVGFANAMEYFFDAIKQINNDKIHFIVVGSGLLKKTFQEELKEYNNVTFIDKIPKNQVLNIISYFDVCYLGRYKSPLYKHGVSYNKYFDYMLASKPILESSELIKSHTELTKCGIIVPPENTQEIIKGIEKLYNLPKEELSEMGKNGEVFVKKFHNYSYLSNLYLNLFKQTP